MQEGACLKAVAATAKYLPKAGWWTQEDFNRCARHRCRDVCAAERGAGLWAHSSTLQADSIDMLMDASLELVLGTGVLAQVAWQIMAGVNGQNDLTHPSGNISALAPA